jgi:hypothetical protein
MRGFADDADLTHPWAEKYRIPLICTSHPAWKYEVALVVPDPTDQLDLYQAVWPDESEAEVIGYAIEARVRWYRQSWRDKMRERPLDVDGGTNTLILLKRAKGWRFRRASWTEGPLFAPYPVDTFPPTRAGLIALLDKELPFSDDWAAVKAEHNL